MRPNLFHAAKPPSERLVTPKVAATALLRIPAQSANRRISQVLSKTRRPFAKRVTKYDARTASRVFPIAIPREVSAEPAVVRFTRKAPAKMAGQKPDPKVSSAVIAMPVGGHTGDALGCTEARRRLNFPARM
jgi:hypothetical protein